MNFTANERRKINTAKRASELQQLRQERDTAREERAGLAIQIGMLITERNELREDSDQLARLCAERHAEIAKLHARIATLQGEPADSLHSLRAQRDAYRQGFAERSQALTESGDKLCRAENERDALRDALRRADLIIRGFDANGLYASGPAAAHFARLLREIAAPEITSIRAVITVPRLSDCDGIPVRPVSRVNIDDAGRAK